MALTAPAKPAKTPVEAGPTRGVCYMCVDLGTAMNEFDGKMQRQILLGFELPDIREHIKIDGRDVDSARTINMFLNFSMNEKAKLRLHLQSWRGKEFTDDEIKTFDLFSVVGKTALLNIVHKTKPGKGTKADINSITALPKGMSSAISDRPPMVFSLADPDHNELTGDIPQWVANIVMRSEEWKALHGAPEEADTPSAESF